MYRSDELDVMCGGVSIKGNHDKNQDAFRYEIFPWGVVAVVADGLGSRAYSEVGSHAICDVVLKLANELKGEIEGVSLFTEIAHRRWLSRLKECKANVSDSYATCLFAIATKENTIIAQIGDGTICMLHGDSAKVLTDVDPDHFLNETDCLTGEFMESHWKKRKTTKPWEIILLATDGIAIGDETEEEIVNFTKEFYEAYQAKMQEEIEADINSWVKEWKSDDDKTIVFLMRKQSAF